MYHRVLGEPDDLFPDEPSASEFTAQIEFISRNFNVLPLSEAAERLASGTLPARAMCVTFDDGYANNLTVAAPLLRAHGIPATVYVATAYLDGGRMFNDTVIEAIRRAGHFLDLSSLGLGRYELPDARSRRVAIASILNAIKYEPREIRRDLADRIADKVDADLPRDLMLTRHQLRELRELGVEVGAHTVNHPILTKASAHEAEREITDSKAELEAITGHSIRHFAYPNGVPGKDYDRSHVQMVRKAGFVTAVSTAKGAATRRCDPLQLPRFAPWYGSAAKAQLRLVSGYREQKFQTV